jgi:hypothetical protein
MTKYSISEQNVIGQMRAKPSEYDLINVIMLCLDDDSENIENGNNNILKLLRILLSGKVNTTKKKIVLDNDFDIKMSGNIEKELNSMCNLSVGIREESELRGERKGMKAMIKMCREFGVSLSDTVKRISAEFNLSIDDAENTVKEYWK